jgi:hypothetical protein
MGHPTCGGLAVRARGLDVSITMEPTVDIVDASYAETPAPVADDSFFSREWVRALVGLAAAAALAPVAGMVLFFAIIPALPIGLFVGFVVLPDQLDRILADRQARLERDREARIARHRRALELEARIYAGESGFGGRAHA